MDSLEQARTALQHAQKLEAVGKLTGGVAHDFNNVLQIIGGSLQLLQQHVGANDYGAKRVESALRAVERGSKLSMQLLAFARRQPLQPVAVNLRSLIRNMDELLRQAVGEMVEIRTIISDELWNTLVDPNQLESVILNLVINSRDAMEGRGALTLESHNAVLGADQVGTHPDVRPGEYVLLAISDTGFGMTPEILEHVFEPFFTTKPEGQGTGLGLSMAYGFVKQSGGDIRVYSEPGHGTTFRIYLPRTLGPEAIILSASDALPEGGTEAILVVEDDVEVQSVVVAMLTDLGYSVYKAGDGESALRILQSGVTIDLLFTDVVMPGQLRGPELARRAKALIPGIAVLFTSGYTQEAIMQDGRLEEGVGLLSKPYNRDQLARKIRQFLPGRSQPGMAPVPATGSTEAPAAVEGQAQAQAPLRILVVEDNDDLRLLACEMLAMLGYLPHGVDSAEKALAILADGPFDVLLTDIGLPGMDGVELAGMVNQANSAMKIILASGYGDAQGRAAGFEPVVLKKPYTMSQLQGALEQM
jgi:CheY-like chemotaxis protein